MINKEELVRYSRHLLLPELGQEGQEKLKNTKVLVVGAGGLGAPLLLYLAAAGIGKIGIVDFDTIEESNLQRQVLFSTKDIGRNKAEIAKQKLVELNPYIEIVDHPVRLTSSNALDIINDYDIVADGTDNFPTRYLINDSCVLLNKVNVYASIYRFEGQVTVFNYSLDSKEAPNYRDLYPSPPPPNLIPSCAEGGVLGVLAGIIGSIQASEVIKVAATFGEPLVKKLFIFDALTMESRIVKYELPKVRTSINGLIDYEEFCNIGSLLKENSQMKEITVKELKNLMDTQEEYQLIDVREKHEYDIANIKAELIPMGEISSAVERISHDKKVIIHCRSGVRSANVIKELSDKHGFENLYNLKGGILAWADEIDPTIKKY